ncbi:putative defense protein 3 [Trichogramma pretiosum]|uniref:Reelin domain-containing protein n=1 Tax=Trichogramma kaykai TaxID=54128 RepID=A0ABD2VVQ4_9HYME|nr:putative defense protein 3 [Trichogramma pretiosum]
MSQMHSIAVLMMVLVAVSAFPDGGPVDACVKPKPNQPYHGQTKPQPASTNPYAIRASTDRYRPGTQVTVRVEGASNFQGFFIQARDAQTNEWIGSFSKTANTKAHGECSAVTHSDPRDKKLATLVWNAPNNKQGSVYFTGTVLKDYGTYWVDVVSQVARK